MSTEPTPARLFARAVALAAALDPRATILARTRCGLCYVSAAVSHDAIMPRLAGGQDSDPEVALRRLVESLERATAGRVSELRRDAADETDPSEADLLEREACALERLVAA